MKEKFFTTEQVANILQVHPFTILKYIKQGKLKGIKLGRVYRIKESDINQFLEDRMTKSAAKSTPEKELVEDVEEVIEHYDISHTPPGNKDGKDHYSI